MSRPQIFVDLDGVLADTDGFYEKLYGVKPNQDLYLPPDFLDNIRNHGSFFRDQPLMSDALVLWEGLKIWHPYPVILSGIRSDIPNMAEQKRAWVDEHIGEDVPLITCKSHEKYTHGKRGDFLIDDRMKYSHYWTQMGGIFVWHLNARRTLECMAHLFSLPA